MWEIVRIIAKNILRIDLPMWLRLEPYHPSIHCWCLMMMMMFQKAQVVWRSLPLPVQSCRYLPAHWQLESGAASCWRVHQMCDEDEGQTCRTRVSHSQGKSTYNNNNNNNYYYQLIPLLLLSNTSLLYSLFPGAGCLQLLETWKSAGI